MSASVVRSDAACCPVATSAAYSASPALATTHGIDYRGEHVDRSIDSGGIVFVAEKEYSSRDRLGV